ncbi:MAG: outer membrane protein assembly factor BamE, partial [Pseudomonadota bacterium]|nr:outer membrane protein assembly factor BamE [Pseudomonadota bacterium]
NAAIPTNKIEAGMTQQAITDLLGTPTLSQTHTLDSLTMIHSEWTNETGTVSIQFIDGIVTFNQFTPTSK